MSNYAALISDFPNHFVFINRFADGQWGQPVQASQSGVVYPEIRFDPSVNLVLRTGPQFSFDIGAATSSTDPPGADAIRMLYTRKDPQGRLYLAASICPLSLSPGCREADGWGIGPSAQVDYFNPNVAAWRGDSSIPPAWVSTFLSRKGLPSKSVHLSRAPLVYAPSGERAFPVDVMKTAPICPDKRGYWGDYDGMIHLGSALNKPLFIRGMTDASQGCWKRWQYLAESQHVRTIIFPHSQ